LLDREAAICLAVTASVRRFDREGLDVHSVKTSINWFKALTRLEKSILHKTQTITPRTPRWVIAAYIASLTGIIKGPRSAEDGARFDDRSQEP